MTVDRPVAGENLNAENNMTEASSVDPYTVTLRIPFPTKRHAEIAYDVLRIDPEPKRSFITKSIALENQILNVTFTGELVKNVRVGLSSFFEALILCCETLKEFGPPADKYDHYDG